MARYQYDYESKVSDNTAALIFLADQVIREFQAQDLTLTLRQLYYQLVAAGKIPNNDRQYKQLGTAVGKGRMLGELDWDAIEDRGRMPTIWNEWDSIEEALAEQIDRFRLPLRSTQTTYVEVWTEKDALSQIVRQACNPQHVSVVVNRGYSSLSAMRMAALRFIEKTEEGKECHLLYLGDHDPSGLDMVRDISDRLWTFEADVRVRPIALTMAQIQQFDPPPNPAKLSDVRAKKYIARHGDQSWEVDALPPQELTRLINEGIDGLTDRHAWNEIIANNEAEQLTARAKLGIEMKAD